MGNARSSRCELVSLGMPQRERDLHLAVMGNDKSTVHQIVAQGVDLDYPWSNPAIPSIKDSTTPLLAAVSLNHVDISMVGLPSCSLPKHFHFISLHDCS